MKNRIIFRTRGFLGSILASAAGSLLFCGISYADINDFLYKSAGNKPREAYVENRLENDQRVLSAVGQCLREGSDEGNFYVTGKNYMPEGSVLQSFYGDDLEYSRTVEETRCQGQDTYWTVRFALKWKSTGSSQTAYASSKSYWSLGDRVIEEIAGIPYTFRCIDQNYQNAGTSGQAAALFLCESVIPSDTGSAYHYEQQESGSYEYVYYPGPIINFGNSSEHQFTTF